jgi:hypothetical protein
MAFFSEVLLGRPAVGSPGWSRGEIKAGRS